MADLSDVENAIVLLVAQVAYPNGTGLPSAAGIPIKVYAGWPTESQLDADLAIGTAHITVYPRQEERNVTRYPKDWQEVSTVTPTLTLTVNGQQITVGGSMPSPFAAHNLVVLANGQYYVYASQASDTLTSIATALASLLAVDFPGTSNIGPVITAANTCRIAAARVGTTGSLIRELRRQERAFQITIWADTPNHRSAVGSAIDVGITKLNFLTMADQTAGRITYKNTIETDMLQKAKLYRRDLMYLVEYATTETITGTQVTQETIGVSLIPQGIDTPVSTINTNY